MAVSPVDKAKQLTFVGLKCFYAFVQTYIKTKLRWITNLRDHDINCFNSLIKTGKEIVIVATKSDKLNQKMKSAYKKNIVDVFNEVGDIKIFLTSSLNRNEIDNLVSYIDLVMN